MKKIMNRPEDIVEEMIEGIVNTHDDLVHRLEDTRVVVRNDARPGKVALISGGGSGHEPAHAGFVGKGMLAAAVCGDVFTSPTPDQIYEGIKSINQGAGVFMIVKNYTGDVMNFEMAKDMADMDGIEVDYIVVDDDIAVEDSLYTAGKRGVAGTVLMHKILGAAAEEGKSLAEIKALAEKLMPEIKTIGLALKAATTPESGKPGFDLPDDEIEFGVGIHSEPGYSREKMKPSKEMAAEMYGKIKKAFPLAANDEVVVLVNGMGGTPLMEQYVFANDSLKLMNADDLKIAKKIVGNYMTSIDMEGISLTVLRVKDPGWLTYLNAPAETIAW